MCELVSSELSTYFNITHFYDASKRVKLMQSKKGVVVSRDWGRGNGESPVIMTQFSKINELWKSAIQHPT